MRSEITYLFWLSYIAFLPSAWKNVGMNICRLCVCVPVNKHSFEPFTCLDTVDDVCNIQHYSTAHGMRNYWTKPVTCCPLTCPLTPGHQEGLWNTDARWPSAFSSSSTWLCCSVLNSWWGIQSMFRGQHFSVFLIVMMMMMIAFI